MQLPLHCTCFKQGSSPLIIQLAANTLRIHFYGSIQNARFLGYKISSCCVRISISKECRRSHRSMYSDSAGYFIIVSFLANESEHDVFFVDVVPCIHSVAVVTVSSLPTSHSTHDSLPSLSSFPLSLPLSHSITDL